MDGHASAPQWLLDSIAASVNTKEYDEFSKAFSDLLHQQLLQNHLTSFADLNDGEKEPFIEATMSKIASTPPSQSLSGVLSSKIDESIHSWVGKQMLLDGIYTDAQPTRTDMQLDGLYDAIVAIVRQFPMLRFRLRVLFNCDIPKKLRPPIWHAFLQNSKIRRQYMNRVAADPRRGLSVMDGEIAKKCDSLLSEHIAFAKFRGSTGALYTMRTAISYYHNLVDAGNSLLAQSEFLLFCPFLYHVASSIPRRQPPHPALITLLVEEFISFLETRPAFVCKPSLDDELCKQFFICVAHALQKLNPELVSLISKWPSRDLPDGYPSSSGLSPALAAVTQPLVRNMFVGFVNHQVLLYIWDQYMLGLDVAGFACELLSIFVALLLHLASSAIIVANCESVAECVECIRQYGLSIQVQQMRYTLHQYFGKKLAGLIPSGGHLRNGEEFAGQPPILLISPGYDGRPNDRLRERQLLERARQQQHDMDRLRDNEMKTRLAELESTLQRRLNEGEQRFGNARQQFDDQLRNEREKRAQIEEKAIREAVSLRAEIEQLKRERDLLAGRSVGAGPLPSTSILFDAGPQATPEVQQLINQYLGRVLDGYDPVGANPNATATTARSNVGPPKPIEKSRDPRYEDPLRFVDSSSKPVLSGIIGAAGPSAARLAHGGAGSAITSPGFTVVNPNLDADGQGFVQRLRAALERAELQLFGKILDAQALEDMSEADRQMAVSRILANVVSVPGL